ncbi:hypothetical protein ABT160_00675 [Streptomyces sp. NPDC001941]|uniref:hypothetical protein n=1 Tax=Streptomyces sp. NPDC001941 TaxID=3154659 RepID=UPI003317FDE7
MRDRTTWAALVVCGVGALINAVDAVVRGRLEPTDAFPLIVALGAGAELLKRRRAGAAKALNGAAGVLLVAAGSAAGYRAWTTAVREGSYDWINLVLGVLTVLFVAAGAARVLARLRVRRAGHA